MRPALLRTTAVATWTATIVGAFTGFDDDITRFSAIDERIWLCVAAGAVVTTLAVGQRIAAERIARLYAASTDAALSRPPYDALRAPSGPMRLVPTLPEQPARRAR